MGLVCCGGCHSWYAVPCRCDIRLWLGISCCDQCGLYGYSAYDGPVVRVGSVVGVPAKAKKTATPALGLQEGEEAERGWAAKAELAEILERRPGLKGTEHRGGKAVMRREARLSLRPQRTQKHENNPAALPVLKSVDIEWDRISAGRGC